MIDQKITNSLNELEQSLRRLNSARQQVEQTVNSYNGLSTSTTQYVNQLGTVTDKVNALVRAIDDDYKRNVASFEKDRNAVIESSNNAINKLETATNVFQKSLNSINSKLTFSLFFNVIFIIAFAVVLYMWMNNVLI